MVDNRIMDDSNADGPNEIVFTGEELNDYYNTVRNQTIERCANVIYAGGFMEYESLSPAMERAIASEIRALKHTSDKGDSDNG